MSSGRIEETLTFTCKYCHISLTVDDSFRGVKGPCPSCGKLIKGPETEERSKAVDHSDLKLEGGSPRQPRERPSSRSSRLKEASEVAAIKKYIVIGVVFLVLILMLVFFFFPEIGN